MDRPIPCILMTLICFPFFAFAQNNNEALIRGSLLNNTNQKSGGYEQLRYDFTNNNPDKFPSKYFYGYGRTFYLNISLKL